jgi:hypothetical protein
MQMSGNGQVSERTLTVACRWGLCNRIRVLLSGLALAEASGRQFTMLWPRFYHCAATFQELFSNTFNVIEGDAPQGTPIYGLWASGPEWQDFLASPQRDLLLQSGTWLVRPDLYPAHRALEQRCMELMETLEPVPFIRDSVAQFRATHFRPRMIGVHLRRGDFTNMLAEANTGQALHSVDAFLAQQPDAGIYLCTDDGAVHPRTGKPTEKEGVRDIFVRRYGERVVFTEPRSLDRRTKEAAEDALIDFLLLRSSDFVVGTKRSSFSRLAVFGRDVPSVMCGPEGTDYRSRRLLWTVTGVYPLLKLLGFIEQRRNVPISELATSYSWRLHSARHKAQSLINKVRRR